MGGERWSSLYWRAPEVKADPRHPSLHFKRLGEAWSVRVGAPYRALGTDTEDGVHWVWIGTHGECDKLVG
jgi:hypothetical protein